MYKRYKFTCRHPGCPAAFVNEEAADRHAAEPHEKCPRCGRHFVEVTKHLAQLKRRGKDCKEPVK